MKRCTAICTRNLREAGFSSQPRRWISYDDSSLTKEALLREAESGLGYHANGRPIKINAEAKTVKTAAGELPISPIMDPAWMKARRRPKKRAATKPTGRFRKKLANNPFALALITPLRRCGNTETYLPRYFFQDFELVNHPESTDNKAWWAPGPLAFEQVVPEFKAEQSPKTISKPGVTNSETTEAEAAQKETTEPETVEAETIEPERIASETEEVGTLNSKPREPQKTGPEATAEAGEKDESTLLTGPSPRRPRRAPLTSYILARKAVIDAVGARPDKRMQAKLLANRHGMAMVGAPQPRDVVWRSDMGDVVLQMMRRRAVDSLIHRTARSPFPYFKFLEPCANWNEAKRVKLRGCVLWLPNHADAESSQYATVDVDDAKFGAKMAVHNLNWLLGEEEVKRLRDSADVFRNNELVVLKQWRSESMIKLHQLLWRLQGYLDKAPPSQ